jgi:hypothetical protein
MVSNQLFTRFRIERQYSAVREGVKWRADAAKPKKGTDQPSLFGLKLFWAMEEG